MTEKIKCWICEKTTINFIKGTSKQIHQNKDICLKCLPTFTLSKVYRKTKDFTLKCKIVRELTRRSNNG